ncbi:MAG: M1 family aminopeptidase [bacterium]|nr:M1 family aminopeptidase [bacterium]
MIRALGILLLAIGGIVCAATPNPPVVAHSMHLTLHTDTHILVGIDTIRVKEGSVDFLLSKSCEVFANQIVGKKLVPLPVVPALEKMKPESDDEKQWLEDAQLFRVEGDQTVVVTWRGTFNDSSSNTLFSREQVADVPNGVISKTGVFLSTSALYYPYTPESIQEFTVTITTPPGWTPVTTGLRKKMGLASEKYVQWSFGGPWQIDALTVAAGEFVVRQTDTLGIVVETCFSPARDSLSATYLSAVKKYLARYSNQFGTYPWPSFSVVEAFFPAGYGLPGFTFLGSEVIALPFIVSTSLGHEVLHNWWGNGVYVPSNGGNWCEGLTTYGADWAYKADKSEKDAAEYRRGLIKDFASYVNDGNDFALRNFTSRSSGATRAVGYGKCAFLFHSLEREIGKDAFLSGLQLFFNQNKYRYAGWQEMEQCFAQTSNRDLKAFFSEWLDKTGAPVVTSADPEFNVWRQPLPGEIPPSLSDLYGANRVLCIQPSTGNASLDSAFRKLAEAMFDTTLRWIEKRPDDDGKQPYVILGMNIPESSRAPAAGNSAAYVRGTSEGRLIGCFTASDEKGVAFLIRKAPHYGKYTYIEFDPSGKNIIKEMK